MAKPKLTTPSDNPNIQISDSYGDSTVPGHDFEPIEASEDDIRTLAYQLWEERMENGEAGDALGDWTRAEYLWKQQFKPKIRSAAE